MTAGLAAFHSGTGVIGALVVGFAAGAVRSSQGSSPSRSSARRSLRAAIALLLRRRPPSPATTQRSALAHIGVPSRVWREAFAVVGAIFVGGTAFVRMSVLATLPADRTKLARVAPAQPRLTAATRQG